jgi:hypothetical protein
VTNSPLGVSVLPLAELVRMIERLGLNVKSGTSPLPPKCGPAESRLTCTNDILATTLSQMLLSANSTKVTSNGPKMLQDSTGHGPLSHLYFLARLIRRLYQRHANRQGIPQLWVVTAFAKGGERRSHGRG